MLFLLMVVVVVALPGVGFKMLADGLNLFNPDGFSPGRMPDLLTAVCYNSGACEVYHIALRAV